MRQFNTVSWRFGARDYLTSVSITDNRLRKLGAGRVEADWDGELADAMQMRGRAIDEESVAESLLADLTAAQH